MPTINCPILDCEDTARNGVLVHVEGITVTAVKPGRHEPGNAKHLGMCNLHRKHINMGASLTLKSEKKEETMTKPINPDFSHVTYCVFCEENNGFCHIHPITDKETKTMEFNLDNIVTAEVKRDVNDWWWQLHLTVTNMPKVEDFRFHKFLCSDGAGWAYVGEFDGGWMLTYASTENKNGFGGHVFHLIMEDGSVEDVKGPWTGSAEFYMTEGVRPHLEVIVGNSSAYDLTKEAIDAIFAKFDLPFVTVTLDAKYHEGGTRLEIQPLEGTTPEKNRVKSGSMTFATATSITDPSIVAELIKGDAIITTNDPEGVDVINHTTTPKETNDMGHTWVENYLCHAPTKTGTPCKNTNCKIQTHLDWHKKEEGLDEGQFKVFVPQDLAEQDMLDAERAALIVNEFGDADIVLTQPQSTGIKCVCGERHPTLIDVQACQGVKVEPKERFDCIMGADGKRHRVGAGDRFEQGRNVKPVKRLAEVTRTMKPAAPKLVNASIRCAFRGCGKQVDQSEYKAHYMGHHAAKKSV